MTKIIREAMELQALPVGTELVDKDGDNLRRVAGGITYRAMGAPVTEHDIHPCHTLGSYMPMIVTTPDDRSYLDDPELLEKVALHLFRDALPGDFMGTATDVLALIKEHQA